MSAVDASQDKDAEGNLAKVDAPADISVSASADRRTLEALYLEIRELAEKNGLTVDYRLSVRKPADKPKT
jgi:hypothetical protein